MRRLAILFFVLLLTVFAALNTVAQNEWLRAAAEEIKAQRLGDDPRRSRSGPIAPDPVMIASANSPVIDAVPLGRQQPAIPLGNRKDPLNAQFDPANSMTFGRHNNPYDEMILDARLNDLSFVNPMVGIAVGDRGAIWRTTDGGVNWSLLESPICCNLNSVHFVNNMYAIIVGGYHYPQTSQGPFPQTGQSRGVVLITQNGGENWTLVSTPLLPALYRVKMIDSLRGFAAGESSELMPTGLCKTSDGGRNWQPVSGSKNEGWLAIEYFDDKNGFGIGVQGAVQTIRNRTELSEVPTLASLRLADVAIPATVPATIPAGEPVDKINGWMVGERGLIMTTTDRGLRWTLTEGALPCKYGMGSSLVDLNTVCAIGQNVWVAGSPGTFIYHSSDAGKSWTAIPSNIKVAIRKIKFVDPQNGYAVGELGTILSTKDGGKRWQVQRAGGTRLGVLGCWTKSEAIPLALFARLCAEEGYLGGSLLLFRDDNKPGREFIGNSLDRANEAMLRVGASGVWETGSFPLPREEMRTSPMTLIERLNRENDGKGLEKWREKLVAMIRTYRPSIIVADTVIDAMIDAGNPAVNHSAMNYSATNYADYEKIANRQAIAELLQRELLEAVRQAGEPTAFPDLVTDLDLPPWTVSKVYLASNSQQNSNILIRTTETSSRLGQTFDELTSLSRKLLGPQLSFRPLALFFVTAKDDTQTPASPDFFGGLHIERGSEARRALSSSYVEWFEAANKRSAERRRAIGIIENAAQNGQRTGKNAALLRLGSTAFELLRKVDSETTVQVLYDMGQQFHLAGEWASAHEIFNLIAEKYSSHPLAREAFVWLLQFYACDQSDRHLDKTRSVSSQEVTYTKDGQILLNSSSSTLLDQRVKMEQLKKALHLARYLDQNFPDIANMPELRFPLMASLRKLGQGQDAARYFKHRGHLNFDDVWGSRARAEYWLTVDDKSMLPVGMRELPMPTLRCTYTYKKPLLDGLFDEEYDEGIWFAAKLFSLTPEKPRKRLEEIYNVPPSDEFAERIAPKNVAGVKREEQLRTASKNFGTQMMLLYDREYLYIGLRVPKAPNYSYVSASEAPAMRDANLDDQDRVEILIDVDRNYSTFYSLTVDYRGWATDSCWDDKSWNPNWSFARHEDETNWYIEAAIPLESLTVQVPMPGTIWGIGVRRIVPGVGIECWNAENSFNLERGLGFLVFE